MGGRGLSRPALDPARVRALRLAAQRLAGPARRAAGEAPPPGDDASRDGASDGASPDDASRDGTRGEPSSRAAGIARWMLALQGQDAPGVRWSVGLRAPGLTDADVAGALEAGAIVRTWPMRGTLHLVHPADVRWLLDLTSARMLAAMAARRATLGITAGDCAGAIDAAHRVLEGRRTLSRPAFLAALDAAGIATTAQRGYHLLAWTAISGHVVLGGGADGQAAVLLADEWLPAAPQRDPDEARAELARRYIASHGPATAADLARWVGLPLTEMRRGIAAAGPALAEVEVDGVMAYVAADALDTVSPGSAATTGHAAGVHLLPGFDEYLLGYADRSAALPAVHLDRVVPGSNGMFRPTVLVDGQVVGTWGRTARARDLRIAVEPFEGAPQPDRDALDAAAARVAAFAGRAASVTITAPPAG